MSAAYYALFHLLIADCARQLSPVRPAGLGTLIQRAFNHGDMRNVCLSFVRVHTAALNNKATGEIPATRSLLILPLELPLAAVPQAFVELQEARHQADCDLQKNWSRLSVIDRVQTARQAFAHWQAVRRTPNAAVFAAALLLQKQWGR